MEKKLIKNRTMKNLKQIISLYKQNFGLIISFYFMIASIIFAINWILSIPNSFAVQDNDWIGFYGSLLGSLVGGLITYLGVQLTITHSQNQEIEKSRKNILPYINVEVLDSEFNTSVEGFPLDKLCNRDVESDLANLNDKKIIKLAIRNIGKDSCCNLFSQIETVHFDTYVRAEIDPTRAYFINYRSKSLIKGENSEEFFLALKPIYDNYVLIQSTFYDLEGLEYKQLGFISVLWDEHSLDISSIFSGSEFPVPVM